MLLFYAHVCIIIIQGELVELQATEGELRRQVETAGSKVERCQTEGEARLARLDKVTAPE